MKIIAFRYILAFFLTHQFLTKIYITNSHMLIKIEKKIN